MKLQLMGVDIARAADKTSVSAGGQAVNLRPVSAVIFNMLLQAHPNFVRGRDIKTAALGNEKRCKEWLSIRVWIMRQEIAGLPLRIEGVQGKGYRLVAGGASE